MQASEFDYHLPPEQIAQEPVRRGTARLLAIDLPPDQRHRGVSDLPQLLRPGDLLVLNDTRVIPARLFARRHPGGGRIELLLVERLSALEWEALARPGRHARAGTHLALDPTIEGEILGIGERGRRRVRFSEPLEPHLDRLGHVPLPPYIRRPDCEEDRERYQTVYARQPGAVAAPTAGLHLSEELLARLEAAGVELAYLTLHVGPGTFRPVATPRIEDHAMDSEAFEIPAATASALEKVAGGEGRVVAVGTTVVRALEAAALASPRGDVAAGAGRTDLFIRPGFQFRVVDALLTNFHLPRSTLLMLVAAFAGRERVLRAYGEAVVHGYRFYSYGDAMLAMRRAEPA